MTKAHKKCTRSKSWEKERHKMLFHIESEAREAKVQLHTHIHKDAV